MKPPMKNATAPTKTRVAPKVTPAKAPMPGSAHAVAEDMHWKAKDALGTLKRAHEIQQDPHLMSHVKQHAAMERDALKKIARK